MRPVFLQNFATKFDELNRARGHKAANCTHDRLLDDKESAQKAARTVVQACAIKVSSICRVVALYCVDFGFTKW